MKLSEAAKLIGLLFAYYPNADPKDETLAVWAQEIRGFDTEDAMEAAHILGTSGKWTPALSEFIDAITECRNDRLERERKMLPAPSMGSLRLAADPCDDEGFPPDYPVGGAMTLAEFLRSRPDMAGRVRKLGVWASTIEKMGVEAHAQGQQA